MPNDSESNLALILARRISSGGNLLENLEHWALDVTRDERAIVHVKAAARRGVPFDPAIAEFAKMEGVEPKSIKLEIIPDELVEPFKTPNLRAASRKSIKHGTDD